MNISSLSFFSTSYKTIFFSVTSNLVHRYVDILYKCKCMHTSSDFFLQVLTSGFTNWNQKPGSVKQTAVQLFRYFGTASGISVLLQVFISNLVSYYDSLVNRSSRPVGLHCPLFWVKKNVVSQQLHITTQTVESSENLFTSCSRTCVYFDIKPIGFRSTIFLC